MRACCLIRDQPAYRRDAFVAGLAANGFRAQTSSDADVLIIWNRYGANDELARVYERSGKPVLIAENGYLGREWRGGHWYALARSHHNGAGEWRRGSAARWHAMGIELQPWRTGGDEVVVLAQRGIGERAIAQPAGWAEQAVVQLQRAGERARIRAHPGEGPVRIPLEADLSQAKAVVTWASGAALKALLWGVPVFYGMPQWIGARAARPFTGSVQAPFLGDREPMFEDLAWAQWNTTELASGEAFRRLLQ
jgi:hypothetical protein